MCKIKLLLAILAVSMMISCSTSRVAVRPQALPLPVKPVYPQFDMDLELSIQPYQGRVFAVMEKYTLDKLALKDVQCRAYAKQLESIIKSTHED